MSDTPRFTIPQGNVCVCFAYTFLCLCASRRDIPGLGKPVLEISNCPPSYACTGDLQSRFGEFGGRYIPETLQAAHEELEHEYVRCTNDPSFREEFEALGRDYIGRPTSLYFARRLTERCGGARIWIKVIRFCFCSRI